MKRPHGVYLVVDPKRDWPELLRQLTRALEGGLGLVQVWNHWAEGISRKQKLDFLGEVAARCGEYGVPVLMHEDWALAREAGLQGVHFDEIPADPAAIRMALEGSMIGVTVGNDLEKIERAGELGVDYISFCAVFPSSSVGSCEIVRPENIRAARGVTDVPIFLSGGIRPGNLSRLAGLDFDGVAVISGILDAADPAAAVAAYRGALLELKN
ncbi:thiamine-phosphate pyrophosphorylase [Lewinella marina]|nr:thiamine phosphate synthase [Neolewinella marina]NJB84332.1 thiamine-phosphate pyrophosphorylase [Neolewinella marina]